MSKKKRVALIIGAMLVVLAFHLSVALQDFSTLARNGYLYDDSFYAFKIAQNIAAGRGISFDGIHPTTGFQPLYVFILVPAYMISGGNPSVPIYIALSILSLFSCMTAYMIFLISRRYVGRAASLIAAMIWAFSPVVTRQSANGLETAIAAFMISASIYYYLDRVRGEAKPGALRFFVLGLLLGLTVLARIDSTFLVLAIMLDYLLIMRKEKTASRSIARFSLLPLGVLVLYGPWLLFNMIESGSPLQDSGTATRFLSLVYAPYFGYGGESLAVDGPDLSFIRTHVIRSVSTMRVIPAVHVLFRAIEKLGIMFGSRFFSGVAEAVLGIFIFLAAGFRFLKWKGDGKGSKRGELDFLLWFSGFLLVSYSFYIFGAFFFLRYYYPVFLTASIYFAFLLQDIFDWHRSRPVWIKRSLVASAAVYLFFFSFFSYSQAFRSRAIYPFYDVARWVDENTAKGETIGVFQCGTIGYLCHRKVINLDGKVNREALEAMKSGDLGRYIKDEGIDVVIDHRRILDIFFEMSEERIERCCTLIPRGAMSSPSGWIAFRQTPFEGKAGFRGNTGAGSGVGVSNAPDLGGE